MQEKGVPTESVAPVKSPQITSLKTTIAGSPRLPWPWISWSSLDLHAVPRISKTREPKLILNHSITSSMATILSLQQEERIKVSGGSCTPAEKKALISDLGHRLQFANENQIQLSDGWIWIRTFRECRAAVMNWRTSVSAEVLNLWTGRHPRLHKWSEDHSSRNSSSLFLLVDWLTGLQGYRV